MPDLNSNGLNLGVVPIATYTATYQINGGTAIAAGATTTAATATFTGAALTDTRYGVSPRDAIVIPSGLQLVSATITATDTVTFIWRNNSAASITPPASATWTLAILAALTR